MAIYLILDHTGTRVKIGCAGNVAARFAALEATNAHSLTLLAIFDGHYKEEWALHRKFTDRHLHSEWFRYDPSMLVGIDLPPHVWTEEEAAFRVRDRQKWGRKWDEDRKRRWGEQMRTRFAEKQAALAVSEAA